MSGMAGKGAKAAVEMAKKAAKDKEVQKATATAVAWVGKKTGGALAARRRNRRRAYALARQIGGKYSDGTIVADRERIVVWKDSTPIACFPPLTTSELDGQKLASRDEFQGFDQALFKDPPPLKPK